MFFCIGCLDWSRFCCGSVSHLVRVVLFFLGQEDDAPMVEDVKDDDKDEADDDEDDDDDDDEDDKEDGAQGFPPF